MVNLLLFKVKVSIYAQYNSRIDKTILPNFGKTKIKDIAPQILDNFIRTLKSRESSMESKIEAINLIAEEVG